MSISPGDRFERWTVIRRAPNARVGSEDHDRSRWWVRCRCLHKQEVFARLLTAGRSSGCRKAACRRAHEREGANRRAREAVLESLRKAGAGFDAAILAVQAIKAVEELDAEPDTCRVSGDSPTVHA